MRKSELDPEYLDRARRRFESFVKREPNLEEKPPECWIWRGAVNGAGYPYFSMFGSAMAGMRAGWLLYKAKHASPHHHDNHGLRVYRTCKTRTCVNPDHATNNVLWSKGTRTKLKRMMRKWGMRLGKTIPADRLSGDARLQLVQTYDKGNPDFLHLQACVCTTPEGVMQVLIEELELDPDRPTMELFEELFPGQQYEDLYGF